MEQLYQRRGYRGTMVGLSTADKDGAVSATYAVQEGELTRIGQITISGLTATKPYVVERELQFEPGEPLTAVALAEARRRLDATRLFDRVDVEPLGVRARRSGTSRSCARRSRGASSSARGTIPTKAFAAS